MNGKLDKINSNLEYFYTMHETDNLLARNFWCLSTKILRFISLLLFFFSLESEASLLYLHTLLTILK